MPANLVETPKHQQDLGALEARCIRSNLCSSKPQWQRWVNFDRFSGIKEGLLFTPKSDQIAAPH